MTNDDLDVDAVRRMKFRLVGVVDRPARIELMRVGADEMFGTQRDVDDVEHPQVLRLVKPKLDRWAHCPKLFPVHLRYQPTQACRDGRREPVDSVPEPLLADGADLVYRDFRLLAGALDLNPAAPVRMQARGERTDDNRAQELVHLVLADDNHRTHLLDFSTDRGVEVRDIDAVASREFRHQSRPSAIATSRSLQSSSAAAIAL